MKRIYVVTVTMLLCSASLAEAEVKTKVVDYSYEGTKLKGYLAWDDAVQGKRPGVLVVHEFWGLNDYARKRAEQLAGMGYVAFACDMYGEGKVTEHTQDAASEDRPCRPVPERQDPGDRTHQQRLGAGIGAVVHA